MMSFIGMTLLLVVGFMMIVLILLQRGRGGGLAGAFGGAGGQSAFGTKAGDVFTKITVVFAVIWVALAGINIIILRHDATGQFSGGTNATAAEPTITSKPGDESTSKTGSETSEKSGESADDSINIPPVDPPSADKTTTPKEGTSETKESSEK
ncbi:MAG: preprotein translocase subunit SecG [Planctomycetota bacterium]|nr:preprotein translocase subunit SecG [Planctomycetota bacterium]MDA1214235.1 preprotein translocase subunit SecG [Planctomycetota bacterium]